MTHVLLDHWDAIEIFCRVLVRYENIKLEEFQNNKFLVRKIEDYKNVVVARNASEVIFGMKTITVTEGKGADMVSRNVIVPKRPKAFHELGSMIRHSYPVVLQTDVYNEYVSYIDDRNFLERKKELKDWFPTKKERQLEGTTWVIYYYHQDKDDKIENGVQIPGIATGILKLKIFGKAEITGYKKDESYTGKFSMYGKGDNLKQTHLLLEMNLKESEEKDLHLLLYIGTGNIELALGQFHNLGRSIYSGTVMVEPIGTKNKLFRKPRFYKGEEVKILPEHVQNYLKDKRKNMLRVPCKVTTLANFNEWHKSKNAN